MEQPIEIVDWPMTEILRHKTPAERLQIAWGMWRSARAMLQCLLRSEHPDWTDAELERETLRRLSHGAV